MVDTHTTPTLEGRTTRTNPPGTATEVVADPSVGMVAGSNPVQTGDWLVLTWSGPTTGGAAKKPTPTAAWTVVVPYAQVGGGTTCFGLWIKQREVGDSSYTFALPTGAGETQVPYYAFFWVSGAQSYTAGAFKNRTTNATNVTSVAEGLTTPADDHCLALALSMERSTAVETEAQITCTNFAKLFTDLTAAANGTFTVATKEIVAASTATGNVTFTYPNLHAFNAVAGQLVFRPVPSIPGLPCIYNINLNDPEHFPTPEYSVPTYLRVSTGTQLIKPKALRTVGPGYHSVDQMLDGTFFIGHRGGSKDFPEMSAYGYTQAAMYGYGALELSVARTIDGVWFGLHDQSLDRVSLGTGGGNGTTLMAANMTWAQVQAYQILGSTAANNPTQPNRPFMRWEELMERYYHDFVFFIDPKYQYGNRAALLNLMDAQPGNPRERFVGKYYGVSGNVGNTTGWAIDCQKRGYKTWGYFYATDQSNFTAYAPRWSVVGMSWDAPQAIWNELNAAHGTTGGIHMCISHTTSLPSHTTIGMDKGAVGGIVGPVKGFRPYREYFVG